MREVGRVELERRVIRPVDPGAAIEAALAHVDAVLAAEWGRVVARDQERWRALVAAHGPSARQVAPTARNNVTGCDSEVTSYDESGQPITGSFMDYALPRAEDIPPMVVGDHPSPAKSKSARHQGLRRSRLRRQPGRGRQRGARCVVRT